MAMFAPKATRASLSYFTAHAVQHAGIAELRAAVRKQGHEQSELARSVLSSSYFVHLHWFDA